MKRVELGKTEMVVSKVVFGRIPVGNAQVKEKEAVEVIKHCLDLGINCLDTAHAYDKSEERPSKESQDA